MTKPINLIAPAFATMSAVISAVKPNKIRRMCSMLMLNDAATSPPNAKPSSAVLQVLIVRPHCRECCSPTIPSHLVGRSSSRRTLKPPRMTSCLYDTNPPSQPLSKTCVVLGGLPNPHTVGNLYQVAEAKPQHTRVCSTRGWRMLIFLLCENSIAYQVLHTPTH